MRIRALPKGPDEDVAFLSFGGQRRAFLDTTTEAHAVDSPGIQGRTSSSRRNVRAERIAAGPAILPGMTMGRPGIRQGLARTFRCSR